MERKIRRLRTQYNIKKHNKRSLPRLSIFRSVKHIYGQVIDINGNVLLSVSSKHIKCDDKIKTYNILGASAVGDLIGQKAKEKKISELVYDRGEYKYHGRVKSLIESVEKYMEKNEKK